MPAFKNLITYLFIFCSGVKNLSAQSDSSSNILVKKNNICVEAGGTGLVYSIGYERNFCIKKNLHHSVKFGISYPFIYGVQHILFPIDYSFYFGIHEHKLLVGGGILGLIGTSPSPNSLSAQKDYRNLFNSNPYSAISKYNTDNFNSSLDIAYSGKIGYIYSAEKINIYGYYNFFYIRFTYKYYFQPLWFGAGVSFKIGNK